jgi:phage terminase large subunit-like protein
MDVKPKLLAPTLPTSWLDVLRASESEGLLPDLLAGLEAQQIEAMLGDWRVWARADQLPPEASQTGLAWTVWLVLGGRGAGKTRTGAEWVRGLALGKPPFADKPVTRIALVGETQNDVREVMIEGVSGLLSVHNRDERPRWQPARRRLEWPNGAVAHAFSAEDPESLRGPQFEAAWLDEIGKWRLAEETFDQLQFGLRLGTRPRQTVTTTPRPTPLLKRLIADPATALTRSKTKDNIYHLAPAFLDAVVKRYAGTRLGRQELEGEMIEERQDALWSRVGIEALRFREEVPPLVRIVVAIDPPASSHKRSDACGIVAAGIGPDGTVYVLDDASLERAPPAAWASRALALYRRLEADALVVETNQGGEMAEAVLRQVDAEVPITPVKATRGKALRAEPVAHLYEQGRVRHAGVFPELEDELCDFGPTEKGFGLSTGRSPDRMDALVWAISSLALGAKGTPRVRSL